VTAKMQQTKAELRMSIRTYGFHRSKREIRRAPSS